MKDNKPNEYKYVSEESNIRLYKQRRSCEASATKESELKEFISLEKEIIT